jgi:hypothetical protein
MCPLALPDSVRHVRNRLFKLSAYLVASLVLMHIHCHLVPHRLKSDFLLVFLAAFVINSALFTKFTKAPISIAVLSLPVPLISPFVGGCPDMMVLLTVILVGFSSSTGALIGGLWNLFSPPSDGASRPGPDRGQGTST